MHWRLAAGFGTVGALSGITAIILYQRSHTVADLGVILAAVEVVVACIAVPYVARNGFGDEGGAIRDNLGPRGGAIIIGLLCVVVGWLLIVAVFRL